MASTAERMSGSVSSFARPNILDRMITIADRLLLCIDMQCRGCFDGFLYYRRYGLLLVIVSEEFVSLLRES